MSFSTLIKDATSFLQLLFNEPTSMALGQLFNWYIERFGYLISLKWITSLPLFPIYIPKLTTFRFDFLRLLLIILLFFE